MQRRGVLSRLGGGLAVATATGLAGCVDAVRDFAECGDDSDTSREWDVDGGVTESSVDGLAIADHEASIQCSRGIDRPFGITVTVENSGNREIDSPNDYEYTLTLYDGDDTDITPSLTSTFTSDGNIGPGESGDVQITKGDWDEGTGPADVARYELAVSCGDDAEGVYCGF